MAPQPAAKRAHCDQSLCPQPLCVGHFFRREMRIENQRAGAARKMREREIDIRVSKLVVGRIHEVACRSRDAIGERTAGMIQPLRRHIRTR